MTEPKPIKRRTNNADRAAARAVRDAAEALKPKIGRPTSFTPVVQEEILQRLEAGETLMKICADPHLPADWSVRRYARTDAAFSAALLRARESFADALGDSILSIADDSSNDWVEHTFAGKTTLKPDREATERSKIRILARQYLMERFGKKTFSQDATRLDPASPADAAEAIKTDAAVLVQPDEAGPAKPVL